MVSNETKQIRIPHDDGCVKVLTDLSEEMTDRSGVYGRIKTKADAVFMSARSSSGSLVGFQTKHSLPYDLAATDIMGR